MKRALILIAALTLALACASAVVAAEQAKYGGFDVVVEHTGQGIGTFSITGENCYGTVDVSGTFTMEVDKETKEWTCTVVFDAGSIVTSADGEVTDLSGQTMTFSGSPGPKKIVYNIVNYIKSILEG